MEASSSKGSGAKFPGRARARDHVGKVNEKTKRILAAVKDNVSSNVDVLNQLSDGFLADDADHDFKECATDLCAASVAWWGNAMDLFHEVVKTCLPEKDPKPASKPAP